MFFMLSMETYFNISITWESVLRHNSSGLVQVNPNLDHLNILEAYGQFKVTHFGSMLFMRFFYCLKQQNASWLAFEKLFTPFERITWIYVVIGVIFVVSVQIPMMDRRDVYDKIVHIFQLAFDQNISVQNQSSLIITFGIFVLTTIYRMQVTSDLIVGDPVLPFNNVSTLITKGYTLADDLGGVKELLHGMLSSSAKLKYSSLSQVINLDEIKTIVQSNSYFFMLTYEKVI